MRKQTDIGLLLVINQVHPLNLQAHNPNIFEKDIQYHLALHNDSRGLRILLLTRRGKTSRETALLFKEITLLYVSGGNWQVQQKQKVSE